MFQFKFWLFVTDVVWLHNTLANYSRVTSWTTFRVIQSFLKLDNSWSLSLYGKKHSFCWTSPFVFPSREYVRHTGLEQLEGWVINDRFFIFRVNYPFKVPDIDTSCSRICLNKPFLCRSLRLQRTFLGPKFSRSTLPDSIPSLPPTRVKKAICLIKLWDVEQTESDLFRHYLDQDCANRPQLG